jgi:hypothetical protein
VCVQSVVAVVFSEAVYDMIHAVSFHQSDEERGRGRCEEVDSCDVTDQLLLQ